MKCIECGAEAGEGESLVLYRIQAERSKSESRAGFPQGMDIHVFGHLFAKVEEVSFSRCDACQQRETTRARREGRTVFKIGLVLWLVALGLGARILWIAREDSAALDTGRGVGLILVGALTVLAAGALTILPLIETAEDTSRRVGILRYLERAAKRLKRKTSTPSVLETPPPSVAGITEFVLREVPTGEGRLFVTTRAVADHFEESEGAIGWSYVHCQQRTSLGGTGTLGLAEAAKFLGVGHAADLLGKPPRRQSEQAAS